MPFDLFETMKSQHSEAYAEIMNLIELSNHHRKECDSSCGASLFLVRRTIEKLIRYCHPQEKQDIILKVTDTNWL